MDLQEKHFTKNVMIKEIQYQLLRLATKEYLEDTQILDGHQMMKIR